MVINLITIFVFFMIWSTGEKFLFTGFLRGLVPCARPRKHGFYFGLLSISVYRSALLFLIRIL